MPRHYGRFTTNIWLDPDFTSLRLDQQAVYFTLGLQPDVSAAGLLPYTSRRWSRLSSGTERDEFELLVAELADHAGRHLVVDEDTEEVLIRKFIKWDLGWYNEKRWPVVRAAVDAIASDRIRHTAVDELRRLALSHGVSAEVPHGVSDTACKRVLDWLSDRASDRQSGFDRVVVKQGEYIPQPPILNPETATRRGEPSDASDGPPSMFCKDHPDGTEDACGPCGTAKLRYKKHLDDNLAGEVRAREARRTAIRDCGRCDDLGMQLDTETGKPLGRCDHRSAS